jgi:acetylornithine deacetylase/succinyl-diaminopimelate desuccinylase-like protein
MAIDFAGQRQRLLDLSIQIQQIPAPTGAEQPRARWIADYLRKAGAGLVEIDDLSNVYACIKGDRRRPALLVSAHTDTVFPAATNLAVRNDEGLDRVYGPGLGDNSVGVAALLWLAEQLQNLAPPVDIWLVANVGEEGNGDLCGMRAAVARLRALVGASIVIEGMGLPRVVHRALGSRRFRIEASAPGGHSWSDYGTASAVHVLVHLAADLTRLKPAAVPRTTFNIGIISGGTSVNTIAQHASLELDLRSEEPASLAVLVTQVEHVVARYQTARWQQAGVKVTATVIGDRPAGALTEEHPLVQAAQRSLAAVGVQVQNNMRISSTDANIPLSQGIPAVCIGITDGGNAHRLDEWITPELLPKGMQHLLALTWWAAQWLDRTAAG